MEFSAELTTAEKITACNTAIELLEANAYTAILQAGLVPEDLPTPYTPPGDSTSHPLQHQAKSEIDKLDAVKAHLATLS